MGPVDQLCTPRLKGERLKQEHRQWLKLMFQNEQVCATLGGTLSDEMIDRAMWRNLHHWDRHGFGIWSFFSAETDEFVGRAGVRQVEVDERVETELAYAVMPSFWKQGYATEMSYEILRVGFEELGLPDVLCFTLTTNQVSQRVMQKLGFTYERDGLHADLPHVFYRLRRDEWLVNRSSSSSGG
ncbi:MAG: GNAT family N-acetyltransferase [Planctomycetota bacterium]|jgi:RimJ/RimL family protein N-acetyltransferase